MIERIKFLFGYFQTSSGILAEILELDPEDPGAIESFEALHLNSRSVCRLYSEFSVNPTWFLLGIGDPFFREDSEFDREYKNRFLTSSEFLSMHDSLCNLQMDEISEAESSVREVLDESPVL